MTLNIQLADHTEQTFRQHAESRGQDLATFVSKMLDRIADSNDPSTWEVANDGHPDHDSLEARRARIGRTFAERLDAWIARHPVLDHEIDISTESIYKGCGE